MLRKLLFAGACGASFLCLTLASLAGAQDAAPSRVVSLSGGRGLTVEDLINAAKLDPLSEGNVPDASMFALDWTWGKPWLVSPDGRHVAIVLRRGNAADGSYDADLLIYESGKLLSGDSPWKAARMSSTRSAPPIHSARWSADSGTLYFVGEQREKPSQVFAVDIVGWKLKQLTRETSNVLWFALAATARRFVVAVDTPPTTPNTSDPAMRDGALYEALHDEFSRGLNAPFPALFSYNLQTGERKAEPSLKEFDPEASSSERPEYQASLSGGLSPSGRYGLQDYTPSSPPGPASWAEYPFNTSQKVPFSSSRQGVIVDFDLQAQKGLDFPFLALGKSAMWIESDKKDRLLIFNAYEPLEGTSGEERRLRAARMAVLDVDPETGRYRRIVRLEEGEEWVAGKWHAPSRTLEISSNLSGSAAPNFYELADGSWRKVQITPARAKSVAEENQPAGRVRLSIEQSLNDPAILVATDTRSGRRRTIIDPNSQLRQIKLAKAEEIAWTAKDGRKWSGMVFYPTDYKPGTKYPLVLQTHGFKPGFFSLHGIGYDYLGRVLAANGFIVLQAADATDGWLWAKPEEMMPAYQSGYEAAIDELDRKGLIDRSRVGMAGWSATGPLTARMLAHSSYPVTTAIFGSTSIQPYWYEDGRDGADMLPPEKVSTGSFLDRLYHPINLNKIHSSIFSFGQLSEYWTLWPKAMRKLGKPLEIWWIGEPSHIMFDVDQRLKFGHLTLDWYRFWLQDYVDPDPAKAEQYRRWMQLRRLYNVDHRKAGLPGLPDMLPAKP